MRSEERAHNERLANDRYREAGRDKHPLRSLRSLLFCILYFSCFIALVSCHYSRPNLEDEHLSKETRDSLAYLFERHYTWNTNLEVLADSVNLACLPVKDCYNMLYRGDRVVVAEFAIHPADSVDSVWVKLAHSQEVQGWLRESEMMHAFVPTDSISQARSRGPGAGGRPRRRGAACRRCRGHPPACRHPAASGARHISAAYRGIPRACLPARDTRRRIFRAQIGRASCRERV